MKRVGILVGRERSFPDSLIETINQRGAGEIVAEYVRVGGVRQDESRHYDLIIDRISHEIPFYRGFLKRAALEGAIIINNPFWWSADDKFFNYSLAAKLGVSVPRTVLLPQKSYIEGVTSDSLRNLEYPLDWQGIIDYVGLPAILKPFDGGGWKNVSRVNSLEEMWREYDQSGRLCMTLQQFIDFDQFVRCYCIGQTNVMIMPYDPRKRYLSGEQYINNPDYLSPELAARVTADVRTLCQALGYDINTVEFAIKDGVPYAIDFMNPAPDADVHSVGEFYHQWVTAAVSDFVLDRLSKPYVAPKYRWDALLNPAESLSVEEHLSAVASAAEQSARPIIPAPGRELGSDILAGVSDLISGTASAVSEIVDTVVEQRPKRAKKTRKSAETSPINNEAAGNKRPARTRKSDSPKDAGSQPL
ncbi:MAG: hypothetical protein WKF30_18540 [Pyrinomonadaceae bacterium]